MFKLASISSMLKESRLIKLRAARNRQPSRFSSPLVKSVLFASAVAALVAVENKTYSNNFSRAADVSNAQRSSSCKKLLDELDNQFDERRRGREEHTPPTKVEYNKKFDLYEPEATCISEERFGSKVRYHAFGDGPKFVCGVDVIAKKAKQSNCLVYSVGSNNDVRFEQAVHTFINGCEVHTFDPTLKDEQFVGGEYATFHPWGLGTDGGKEGNTMHGRANDGSRKSFETIIKELGHENRKIDILKIDCQGCEYSAMPPLFELIASGKVQVDQVLIEMHARKDGNFLDMLRDFFMAADKAKLRIFHKERNGWGCDGFRCVEYAFVSESFLREANGASMCPGEGAV